MSGTVKPWIRLHRSTLTCRKFIKLSHYQRSVWLGCLMATDDDGVLPSIPDLAIDLRMDAAELEKVIAELVEAGFVDISSAANAKTVFKMHDWDEHQFSSDCSTDRVRKFRSKNKEASDETFHETERNVSETPPDYRLQTTDSESKPSLPEQDAARVKAVKNLVQGGKARRGVAPRLQNLAKGLGLPVDELVARATAPDVREPNAMFRHCAVDQLQTMLPRAKREMLAAALTTGGEGALAALYGMILEGAS